MLKKHISRFRDKIKSILSFVLTSSCIIIVGYFIFVSGVNWPSWTGFDEYSKIISGQVHYERAKTLWDWLELLIVPMVLAMGVWWLDKSQRKSESAIELDGQRQTAFEAYLDHMTSLLLEHSLRSSHIFDEVRCIARARTMAIFPKLDGLRKGRVIRFLHEALLINAKSRVISLKYAELQGVKLAWAHLEQIQLQDAILDTADFKFSHLENANFDHAKLKRADFEKANLTNASFLAAKLKQANFKDANLSNADLSNAYLFRAVLRNSDLRGANLEKAILSKARLIGARYDRTTRWPRGFQPDKARAVYEKKEEE